MKKATIDTLKGYLCTGLKMRSETGAIFTLGSLGIYKSELVITDEYRLSYLESKPILYPLHCFFKPIVVANHNNSNPFMPIDEIGTECEGVEEFTKILYSIQGNKAVELPYWVILCFQKWFINYQNLEAINPFDLPKNPYEK